MRFYHFLSVWTAVYKPDTLNIIHAHLNDMSDQVSVDVAYLKEHETAKDHQEFKADVTGQVLRYKILVKEMKVSFGVMVIAFFHPLQFWVLSG